MRPLSRLAPLWLPLSIGLAAVVLAVIAVGHRGHGGADPRTGWVEVRTPDGRWVYDQTCADGDLVKRDGTGQIFETTPNARECW